MKVIKTRISHDDNKPRFKVSGSGNRWYLWKWGGRGQFWDIVRTFLTRRAAVAAMKKETS